MEMMCLNVYVRVTGRDKVRNDEMRCRAVLRGVRKENTTDKMKDEWKTNRVYKLKIKCRRAVARLCTRWLNGIEKASSTMLLELRDVKIKR